MVLQDSAAILRDIFAPGQQQEARHEPEGGGLKQYSLATPPKELQAQATGPKHGAQHGGGSMGSQRANLFSPD
jgi:hypothetical protein